MARKSRKKANREVKQRRQYAAVINSIVRSEPVIRVRDRRRDYGIRRGNFNMAISEGFRKLNGVKAVPLRRTIRKLQRSKLQQEFPQLYKKQHDCNQEWRKTLAWRASQGAGRKRTQRELKNNKESFMKNDC